MGELQTGGCLCGKIRYEISAGAEPDYSVICHCNNCKKANGSHIVCANVYLKSQFSITSGTPKTYIDLATDSGKPLFRNFCGDCGSPLFATTPLRDVIVSIFSGTMDQARTKWTPNKEQYIATKSQWLPEFDVQKKEGVQERHVRDVTSAAPTLHGP